MRIAIYKGLYLTATDTKTTKSVILLVYFLMLIYKMDCKCLLQ